MTNKNNIIGEHLTLKDSDIPLESNLGLLAYGDIAFVAWRKLKKASNKNQNEAE